MRLDDLAGGEIGLTVPAGAGDTEITALTLDSRQVRPGTLFVAVPGRSSDGRRFVADAVAAGAAAVLAPTGTSWPEGVPPRPLLLDSEPRYTVALLAARLAGPQPERIAAITGTNGKTSTAEFLRQLWTLDGSSAASLGTLGLIAPKAAPAGGTSMTTPDSIALAGILSRLRRDGVEAVALEASSHGLDQYRLDGVAITAAGFSNLTRDHLDYHGTLSEYRRAKLRLFDTLLPEGGLAAVNADMDAQTLERVTSIARTRRHQLRLVGERGTTMRLLRTTPQAGGQRLELEIGGRRHEVALPLPGRTQADNVLLATALADPDDASLERLLQHLPALAGVRGRMELAATLPNGAAAYVDYAHTPDALERLLHGLRPHAAGGRLVVVFGAGGDRDRGKRPMMGEVAQRLADVAIVTDDNPRSETPAAIRSEIMAACGNGVEVGGRERAISAALQVLRPGDVLVVAGKGHEQGQTIGDETLPFDDREVIRRLAGTPGHGPRAAP
ncbi:UDP-N-acetylmuramoyl-L-alanyl-D-glutamate--2,6-diaminopimelate ligase [Lichenicoccus roseus]|uniref:UDP-N-acetylmuramoyl-L-alanyl-D-glutamate--2,6-diaminopimelate ligase n=1 Tax=Lichenicoccus roseus TaxID=2683649 RepID=A0A5R9J9M4_9PROT|nr:UDP-N-acetylmuramoyl-L-alanyl-D-glutamate--2,6-diaminopimelate ligase [Lichenicoccus roseus]TLU73513.1 UDP-N-acetylmuramoyl-L-alanyl-D-glutamate--2,6-diaminopimelate ligase [Lichenicoccus roseus]